MKRKFGFLGLPVLACSLLLLGGCSRSPKEKLIGTWEADFKTMMESGEMSEQEKKMFETMFANSSIQMTFLKGGALTMSMNMMGKEKKDSGTWKITSSEGNEITVKCTSKEQGNTKTLVMTFTGDDIFSAVQGGQEMVFKRVRLISAGSIWQEGEGF